MTLQRSRVNSDDVAVAVGHESDPLLALAAPIFGHLVSGRRCGVDLVAWSSGAASVAVLGHVSGPHMERDSEQEAAADDGPEVEQEVVGGAAHGFESPMVA